MKPLLIALAVILVLFVCVLLFAAILNDAMAAVTTAPITQAPEPDVHEHTFDSWKTLSEPTCTEDGQSARSCKVCDYTETKTVPATGHKWTYATCDTPKTCRACQQTEGEARQHEIVNGVCVLCQTTFRSEEEVAQYLKIVNVSIVNQKTDGVNVDIGWENLSDKAIRYIHFDLIPLDEAGNALSEVKTVSGTGSYAAGQRVYTINSYGKYQKSLTSWQRVWYDDAIASVKIDRIHILYQDDTRVEFSANEAEKAFGSMSLSTTLKEMTVEAPYFYLTNQLTNGILFQETKQVPVSMICDEDYNILKSGKVTVVVSAAQSGTVIVEHTMTFDERSFDEYNRLLVDIPFNFDYMLVIDVNVSFTFYLDDMAEPYVLETDGILHARP